MKETPVDELPVPRHPLDVAVLVRRTEALLRAGVPLSLLLDLADDAGPHSHTRYTAEGGDAGWLTPCQP
jgi:hypothetical protein